MKRPEAQEPTVAPTRGVGETETTHPAFAQIGASRVTSNGGQHLYGSDFNHHNFMTIAIRRSTLMRNMSHDWHFGGDQLIEVAMSEAQWASFVSSPNMGSGVPCTLQYVGLEAIPAIKQTIDRRAQFADELRRSVERIEQSAAELLERVDAGTIGKKELRSALRLLAGGCTNSASFVAKSFDEHTERTVEKAKIEVSAYVTSAVMRAGLKALESPVSAQIEGGREKEDTCD